MLVSQPRETSCTLQRSLDFSFLANDRATFSLWNDHCGSNVEDGLNRHETRRQRGQLANYHDEGKSFLILRLSRE